MGSLEAVACLHRRAQVAAAPATPGLPMPTTVFGRSQNSDERPAPRLAVNAVLKQLFACTPKTAAAMACSNFAYRHRHATTSRSGLVTNTLAVAAPQ